MGLTFQLIPTFFFLLTCTSDVVQGRGRNCQNPVREIINIASSLSVKKFSCFEMVPDIFEEDTENSSPPKLLPQESSCSHLIKTDFETLCRAATVLQQAHLRCSLPPLNSMHRNLMYLVNKIKCPVNETKMINFQDFLSKLKTINQKIFFNSMQL
ncbi:interleukin-4 [Macrotis lagotis]|uniref:interleukin-4 n=1 Tax=Macrotis lagotis TaxID=92651 RepID=UPI003D681895